ncbi:ribosomal maturation YjgA family protein [Spirosoma foliorum]|uniref:DUF2809 domain-containing protein n=1 Tax=Spirosoma foliorum TaxID=2710596 RepID=A0A7G5H1U5_9BACT|nr:DUF2809 domain-containing protein [Spirosoma foliorum]QMW05087.1 DUF2809 domain-containing protein [Spirosoma foliorum]
MHVNRNRIIYGSLTLSVLLLGLASRRFMGDVSFVKDYVGDGLWALMVYLGFATFFNQWTARAVGLSTLLFSFGIEISQIYHAPWIDTIRATRLGGLVLGFTFVWSDLLCYTIGVGVGWLVEAYLIPARYQSLSSYKL